MTNYEEALKKQLKNIKTNMKIVPRTSVQDAIDYLRSTD